MILLTREFDQTSPSPKVQAPPGSRIVSARMSRMGQCLVTMACPEVDEPEVDYELLFLFEDIGNTGGGDPDEWDHVSTWLYSGSRQAHLFVRVPVITKPSRARRLTGQGK